MNATGLESRQPGIMNLVQQFNLSACLDCDSASKANLEKPSLIIIMRLSHAANVGLEKRALVDSRYYFHALKTLFC